MQMLNAPLEKNDAREVTFTALRSYGHQIFLQEMTKKMLSAYNDTVFDRYPQINRHLGHKANRLEKFEGLLQPNIKQRLQQAFSALRH